MKNAVNHLNDSSPLRKQSLPLHTSPRPFSNLGFPLASQTQRLPTATRPVLLNRQEGDGNTMVIDFNVADCWRFEDNNGDGYFGGQDIDPQVPSAWVMELPVISVSFQD